ncbi:hypothetical protein SBOR_7998 [Sclerotinia borealis F-4128]|uniref:Fungal-type protein kinase domain-containing protein n=1 Tax=Sclerotinia borealis (strain F-4128) TaxID=1432307 RepID=W9C6Z7_SCLBF|nr:hypothetical protein SBOR_7998 [Sclerotinia borealis F-4128]
MSSTWVPHGHILDKDVEEPYQNAKVSIDAFGKGHHSIILIEDLCRLTWFPLPDFKSNSQIPPSYEVTKGPNKAKVCDLVTRSLDKTHKWYLFSFHEGKEKQAQVDNSAESGSTININIKDLENRAQDYCKEFFDVHRDVDLVYVNTFSGVSVRFWSVRRGDETLRGFWGGDEKDHFEHYRDVGLDAHFHDIERALLRMRPVSIPPVGQVFSQIGTVSLGGLSVT